MCRHLGYLGPPTAVGDLLTCGSHSLRTQAWAPRDMRGGGTINADGFGVAWWIPAGPGAPTTAGAGVRAHGGPTNVLANPATAEGPGDRDTTASSEIRGNGTNIGRGGSRVPLVASRYRNADPIWTDPAVDEVLPQLKSTAVLAAVRSATVGMPVERAACAPFTHGRWAFSHNGAIPDWQRVLTAVAAEFGSPALLEAESRTDSATLWVILRGLLESAGGAGEYRNDPAAVLARLVRAVLARSPRARLTLLLGDGDTFWATTVHHSLSALVTGEVAVLASEPYDDDPRWQAIADRRLVTARPGQLSVVSLEPDDLEPDDSERARS
jgi:glutamine amidotransferase